MTITLLKPYATYAQGASIDLDNATEASLVAQGRAVYTANPGSFFSPLSSKEQQDLRDMMPGIVYTAADGGLNVAGSSTRLGAMSWGGGQKRSSFITKPAGGLLNATASPNTATSLLVTASPVPYYAVRIHYQHWGGAGAIGVVTGFKAILGASDDIGTQDWTATPATGVQAASFKKCVTPRRGGVAYETVVTDGSPGWKAVTWSGASSVNVADPGAGNVLTVSSDIIYEQGVIDANGVYPLLLRYYFGSAGYTYVSNATGQQLNTNWATDVPGLPFLNLQRGGSDSVTTPASWLNSSTPSESTSSIPVFIEFFTADGVMSVQCVGDSRLAISSELSASKAYLSTEIYLYKALRSAGKNPALIRTSINGAGALRDNQATTGSFPVGPNYFVDAYPMQSFPQPASWLVYLLYSVNDGTLTDGVVTLLLARAADIAAKARASGQRVCFLTAFPKDSGFTTAELARIATLRAFAAAVGDTYFDPIVAYGDATGAWAIYRFDTSHMTDAGYQAMAASLAALLD